MVGIGVVRVADRHVARVHAPERVAHARRPGARRSASFLILRAFSSGAAALTGVEAISDGVPAFKPPEWRNARITLVWAAAIFAALFLGISFMASTIGIVPDPSEENTVLSQVARVVVGEGAFFIVIQVATVLVLALAANTAFADFPRLSSFLARDSFMPRQFAFRGERLAFTTGIVALSGSGGTPARRIRRERDGADPALHARRVPGLHPLPVEHGRPMVAAPRAQLAAGDRDQWLGALTTGVIAIIVVESKFLAGAWMVVIAIPLLVLLMLASAATTGRWRPGSRSRASLSASAPRSIRS